MLPAPNSILPPGSLAPANRINRLFGGGGGGGDPVAGDILNVAISADGWWAEVTIKDLGTGGTYDFGLGTDNVPEAGVPKIAFTVTSKGFQSGQPTTRQRTVWGVAVLPQPAVTTPDETVSGDDVVVRVVLSDTVYAKDKSGAGNSGTNVSVTVLSGFYSQGGTPNNGFAGTATNNSTVAYRKAIANWAWGAYERVTDSLKARLFAAAHHPFNGNMGVDRVEFTLTDGTNSVTEVATSPGIDATMPDQVPVVEWLADLSVSTLTQGAALTLSAKIYPFIGDEVSDSDLTGFDYPSPMFSSLKFLCDKDQTYGISHAVVDPVAGSDPAGVTLADDSGKWVGAGDDPGAGGGVTAYATIARAARAIRNRNNSVHGRDDVGAGIIFLKSGSYNWLGATISGGYGSVPLAYCTVKRFPGVDRSDVLIAGLSGNPDISDRVRVDGVKITSSTNNTFNGIDFLWFHDCELASPTTTGLIVGSGTVPRVWLITHSKITQLNQGLRASNTTSTCHNSLVRGCDLNGYSNASVVYTWLGNSRTNVLSMSSIGDARSTSQNPLGTPILAFNKLMGLRADTNKGLEFGAQALAYPDGSAIIQNIFENATGTTQGIGDVGASEGVAANTPYDNLIFWNNTLVGERMQFGYNSEGGVTKWRRYWSVLNNYWDVRGLKGERFGTPDPARIGNRMVMFSVGGSGNIHAGIPAISADGFHADFAGLNSRQLTGQSHTYPQFTDRKSYTGSDGDGNGDYSLQEGSPLRGLPRVLAVPFDIAGIARDNSNNHVGAHAS